MDWNDQLRLLRWRALEEADTEGKLLSHELRDDATLQAGTSLPRVAWLESHTRVDEKALPQVARLGSYAAAGWVAAFITGYALTYPGEERLINLLSLPLMGLVLWNAAVITLSLWRALRAERTVSLPAWLLWQKRGGTPQGLALTVQSRFRVLAGHLVNTRRTMRLQVWFHLGAALLALGTITGMYAKGWSKEYQAVWESTLLDEAGARRFLGALYKPASLVLDVPIPLDQLPAMRARPGSPATPGEALPWIHLYCGTLALLVLLPRLALAGLVWRRGEKAMQVAWENLDWPGYDARRKLQISGAGAHVQVLCHGWRAGDEPRNRWSQAVRAHFGGQCLLEFQTIPAGDEDDFLVKCQLRHPNAVLAFNAATTPEMEVHAALARDLRTRFKEQQRGARLVALLDTHSLKDRRSDEGLETRLKLWQHTLRDCVDNIIQV